MDQIHNHYSGPITVQGANYQSHYVPAEKPYAVYAFVYDGPFTTIAQLIGTMLTGKVNEEGKMCFESKAVYRMPNEYMLDFEHCYIPDDMGPMISDPIFLGFVGDTIGKDKLVKIGWMDLFCSDGYLPMKSIIKRIMMTGLKINLADNCKMKEVEGDIKCYYGDNDSKSYYLEVRKDIALKVNIWNSDELIISPREVLSGLWRQINNWDEVGVTFENIMLKDGYADYQLQVNELIELAKLYGNYVESGENGKLVYHLLCCLEKIGKGRCFYDDFVMAMKKARWESYNDYDKDLQLAIDLGYVSRDGNIIQFSSDLERMATWKWQWLHGEDK